MRLATVVGLLLVLAAMQVQVVADSRRHGSGDTARQPESDVANHRDGIGHQGGKRPVVVPPSAPAIEHYWSQRCVDQRRYGVSHTKDCDNPAYTGGGYPGYSAPYPRYEPYGAQGYRPYAPYRGGIDPYPGGPPSEDTYEHRYQRPSAAFPGMTR